MNNMTAEELSKVIIDGMEDKKALDIVLIDLRSIKNTVTDFFVICSGTSDTQLEAIADSIEEKVKKSGEGSPYKIEGKKDSKWILVDYVNVVVHIFLKDQRAFYGLEELWGDAKVTHIQ